MLKYLILLCLVYSAFGFFDFFSKKKSDEIIPTEYVRQSNIKGVPNYLEDLYTKEIFTCLNKEITINRSAVNDGYCDCSDGSDEPGTSACVNGVFHCINKGYRIIKLPSSRIDDGICDCCDGSDEELVTLCPNSCEAIAKQEREHLNKLITTYKIGSAKRIEIEQILRAEYQPKADALEERSKLVDELTTEIEVLTKKRDYNSERLKYALNEKKTQALKDIWSIVGLNDEVNDDTVQFLVSLFDILKLNENDILRLLNKPTRQNIENNNHDHDHDREHHDDDISSENLDEYDSESEIHSETESHEISNDEIESITNQNIIPSDNEIPTENCPLIQFSLDNRIKVLCDKENTSNYVKEFIINKLIKEKQSFNELQLLLGYYHINGKYDSNVVSYVKEMLLPDVNGDIDIQLKTCPLIDSQETCDNISQISIILKALYNILLQNFDDKDEFNEISIYYHFTKESIESLEKRLEEAIFNKEESIEIKSNLIDKDFVFYDLKLKEFTINDRSYVYNINFFDIIKQTEIDRTDVTLGNFKSIDTIDDATYVWRYEEGDHCWNFGPRTTHIAMTCGIENKILSVREPSTCFYKFEFESPLACTLQFAETNGLLMEHLLK